MDAKVNKEMAEVEFNRFVEEMDLDVGTEGMDAEDLTAFTKQKSRILRAVERGSLVFNDSGEAVYTPSNERSRSKEPITFQERSGASLMVMDGKKKGQEVAKTYAVMAEMCGIPQKTFAGLVGTDIKVCEALFALLMD